MLCASTRDGGITSYELAIPSSALPEARFGAGARLRFSVLVNEDDGEVTRDGTGREGWLELTRSIGARKAPESFAEIVFEDRFAREGVDAGTPNDTDADSDVLPDAGPGGATTASGCACRSSAHRNAAPEWLLLAPVAVLARRRQRGRR